jgi:hypothetical protein
VKNFCTTDGKKFYVKILCKILCELYYRSATGCLNTIFLPVLSIQYVLNCSTESNNIFWHKLIIPVRTLQDLPEISEVDWGMGLETQNNETCLDFKIQLPSPERPKFVSRCLKENENYHSPPSIAEIKKVRTISPLPHTSSWHSA